MSIKDYAHKSPVDVQHIFRGTNNAPIITASGQATVQRESDFQYWIGTGTTFQVAPFQVPMIRISDANSPGLWELILPTLLLPRDSYLFVITDANALAANVPATATAVVGDAAMVLVEAATAAALGRAKYDPITSVETLFEHDDPNTVLQLFDMKDRAGSPAGEQPFFEKVPQ